MFPLHLKSDSGNNNCCTYGRSLHSRICMFHFETYTPRRHGRSSLRLNSEVSDSDLEKNLSRSLINNGATDSMKDARDKRATTPHQPAFSRPPLKNHD